MIRMLNCPGMNADIIPGRIAMIRNAIPELDMNLLVPCINIVVGFQSFRELCINFPISHQLSWNYYAPYAL